MATARRTLTETAPATDRPKEDSRTEVRRLVDLAEYEDRALSIAVAAERFRQPLTMEQARNLAADPGEASPLRKTAEGLRDALIALGVQLRYNTRSNRRQIRRDSLADADWADLTDRAEAALFAEIRRTLEGVTMRANPDGAAVPGRAGLHFGRESRADLLNALSAGVEEDPFLSWIEALPAWDGVRRLDGLLGACFEVEDGPLTRWAAFGIVGGAVARAMVPGLKLDETVILQGDGGIGKSTFAAHLLPGEHRGEWFGEAAPFSRPDKERVEALQGRAIVEMGELRGLRVAELADVKAFLTRADDGSVRLAYRRNPEPAPRRCVFVGSTDQDTPLPNDPNDRRFVIVPVGPHPKGGVKRLRVYLEANRGQLWAEARARVRGVPTIGSHGATIIRPESPRLPDALVGVQRERNEQFRQTEGALEDSVAAWVAGSIDPEGGFTLAEVAAGAGLAESEDAAVRMSGTEQAKLGRVLRGLGFGCAKRETRNGRKVRLYRPI